MRSLCILFLLCVINFAPPLLAILLEDKWSRPIDGGRKAWDGHPLLGSHKTLRGFLAGVLAGAAGGFLCGFAWWEGLLVGFLSMFGDLLSSFIKRRLAQPSGTIMPGLDQVFEGSLPLLYLASRFSLSALYGVVLLSVFALLAFAGSWLFKKVLLMRPAGDYPRRLSPRTRLRELRACQIAADPLHHLVNFESAIYYHVLMRSFFKMTGLYERGRRNALEVGVRRLICSVPALPHAFEGYTILLITDAHLDGLEGLTERLEALVETLPVDLCLLGGDIRMGMSGPSRMALLRLTRVIHRIRTRDGLFGVLGNHDCIEMIQPLEDEGVVMLVNESCPVERPGGAIWVVGLDDPHHYRCDDLEGALADVPEGAFTILLSHSPEVYRKAALKGVHLYLCGHTHGGQVCMPRLGPIFTHSRSPRAVARGCWKERQMLGYTSRGAGVSGVAVRYLTQGEVVHLTLRAGPPAWEELLEMPGGCVMEAPGSTS